MVNDLSVVRCRTREEFAGLGAEWNRLLARTPRASMFLSWEWLYCWWIHFGAACDLRLYLVRDRSNTLVGLGPFCVDKGHGPWATRTLKFLGTRRVSSEYLDLLAEPERERDVAAAVVDALREDVDAWDRVELTDLLDSSLVLRHVAEAARAVNCATRPGPGEVCPYLPLPASHDELLASLTRWTRGKLKRSRRTLETLGATWRSMDAPDALGPALESFFDLHGRRWGERGLTGNFHEPAVRAFHRQLLELLAPNRGIRFYVLEHGGKALAFLYTLMRDHTVYFYQSAFDPTPPVPGLKPSEYSPGFVLLGYCIQDSIDRGAREFDFLRGLESYKQRWTSRTRTTHKLTVIPRERWSALVRHTGEQWIRSARRAARQAIRWSDRPCVA